jgi:hypothetical protein
MENVIKCEFCEGQIDLDNTDTCPKCKKSIFLDPNVTKHKTLLDILLDDKEKKKVPTYETQIMANLLVEELYEKADPDAHRLKGFEYAIIGVGINGAIVYDFDKIVTILVVRDKMEVIEAEEYIYTNIIDAEYEALAPILIKLDFLLLTNSL